jgi:Polyketide cyclase / dehydrase and lipid transport
MVSHCRQQTFIEAPPMIVWNLLSDVDRHEDWWPGIVEVECEGLEAGCTYRQVVINPFGRPEEETFEVEQMEDCERLSIRCVDTGTFVRFALTEAQGGTFLDGEAGMEPARIPHRLWDAMAGKRFYRDWLAKSLDSLGALAKREAAPRSGDPRP